MNLNAIDANLLVVFNAMAKERNVTLSAQRLGISQPAMSNALARLRRLFDDPLFVRTPKGMQPTPFAERLVEPVAHACMLLETALQTDSGFDPASAAPRSFTLYLSDIGEMVFLPKVLHEIRRLAPRMGVAVRRVPESGMVEAMAAGEADLAVGIFPVMGAGMYQQALYEDGFVCIARRDHPQIKSRLSTSLYLSVPHAVVAASGTTHESVVEKALGGQRLKRQVAVSVPHFLPLPSIVAQTDAIATIPARMVSALPIGPQLKVLKLPFKTPKIEIRQYWHERYHHDAANRWLRELVARLLQE